MRTEVQPLREHVAVNQILRRLVGGEGPVKGIDCLVPGNVGVRTRHVVRAVEKHEFRQLHGIEIGGARRPARTLHLEAVAFVRHTPLRAGDDGRALTHGERAGDGLVDGEGTRTHLLELRVFKLILERNVRIVLADDERAIPLEHDVARDVVRDREAAEVERGARSLHFASGGQRHAEVQRAVLYLRGALVVHAEVGKSRLAEQERSRRIRIISKKVEATVTEDVRVVAPGAYALRAEIDAYVASRLGHDLEDAVLAGFKDAFTLFCRSEGAARERNARTRVVVACEVACVQRAARTDDKLVEERCHVAAVGKGVGGELDDRSGVVDGGVLQNHTPL